SSQRQFARRSRLANFHRFGHQNRQQRLYGRGIFIMGRFRPQ
uniref:Uncharacterized protein n=1 Tax=Romanomermis culicivorax TaxID=13658 RepID=A0A915JWF1_ROMCU